MTGTLVSLLVVLLVGLAAGALLDLDSLGRNWRWRARRRWQKFARGAQQVDVPYAELNPRGRARQRNIRIVRSGTSGKIELLGWTSSPGEFAQFADIAARIGPPADGGMVLVSITHSDAGGDRGLRQIRIRFDDLRILADVASRDFHVNKPGSGSQAT